MAGMKVRLPTVMMAIAMIAVSNAMAVVPAGSDQSTAAMRCEDNSDSKDADLTIALCSTIIATKDVSPKMRAVAYFERGNAYNHKKQYRLAVEDFKQAIRLDPKMAEAYSERGDAYAELEQYDLADADYKKAARLNPARYGAGDPETVAAGQREERIQTKSVRASERPPSLTGTELAPAISFQELLAIRKSVAEATSLDRQAQALYDQGRFAEAQPLFLQVLQIRTKALGERDRDTLGSVNNYAIILSAVGRADEAAPLIKRAYEILAADLGESAPATLNSLNNLAANLMARGLNREAEPLLRKALDLRRKSLGANAPQTLDSMNALGVDLMDQGRSLEAEALFRKTVQLQTEVLGEEHSDTLATIANLGVVLMDEQRAAEAEPLIRKALAILTKRFGERHEQTMGSLHNLAVSIREQGRFAEAEPLYRKALQLQTEVLGERHPDTLRSLGNLAADVMAQGRIDEAFLMFEKALKLQEETLGERHPETLGTAFNLALSGHLLGLDNQIEPLLARTLALQTQVLGAQHPQTLESAVVLAECRLRLNSAADALTPARMAVSGWRARQQSGGASARNETGMAREAFQQQDVNLVLANAAWQTASKGSNQRQDLDAETFAALQEYLFGTTSKALAQTAARNAADSIRSGLGELVRRREHLLDEWNTNDLAQTKALGESQYPQLAAARQALMRHQSEIEAGLASVDTQLRKAFPDYFALVRPKPLDISSSQTFLKPDEAILLAVPTEDGTHLIVVTHDSFKWVRADWNQKKVDAAVRRLLWDVGADVGIDAATAAQWEEQGGEGYPFDRKTAFALYQQLVAPVSDLLSDKRHLFVVPGGILTSIPFGILVAKEPQGADGDPKALRQTSWMADQFIISVIPSIQSLELLRSSARPKKSRNEGPSFQGYGDPVLQGKTQVRGPRSGTQITVRTIFMEGSARGADGIVDVSKLIRLAKLPGTAIELSEIGAALGAPQSAVHTQGEATESAIKAADLSSVRILAFATHGLMAGEIDGAVEPGLVFTPPNRPDATDDGFLSTSEIAGLKLAADWVILSACNTASGDGSEGAPGLSGLARAFFYAGARNLLVSHWPVRDDVAARITVEAIKLTRAHPTLGRAEALQKAMRKIRDDSSHDTAFDSWAHPNAWAPFSLVGDGAPER